MRTPLDLVVRPSVVVLVCSLLELGCGGPKKDEPAAGGSAAPTVAPSASASATSSASASASLPPPDGVKCSPYGGCTAKVLNDEVVAFFATRAVKETLSVNLPRPPSPEELMVLSRFQRLSTLTLPLGARPGDLAAVHPPAGLRGLTISTDPGETIDLAPLKGLAQLNTLEITDAHVTNLAALSALPLLRVIWFQGKGARVDDLAGLATLPVTIVSFLEAPLARVPKLPAHVSSFVARGSGLTDISALAGHDELATVSLADNPVVDLAVLCKLKALSSLNLEGTKVSSLAPLSACSELDSLDLRRTPVRDLAPLAKLPKLKILRLTSDIPKATVDAFQKASPKTKIDMNPSPPSARP